MLYKFICNISKLFFKIFFKPSFEGLKDIPADEPFIICSNHISLLDMFLFVPPMLPRRIHFMAKQELFKIPILASILRGVGAFPVKRGSGDLNAVKTTLKLLKQGKTIGIFPEGTRLKKSKSRIKPKYGAILFSLSSGTRILPVGINGDYKIFSKLRVVYGEPYKLPYKKGEKLSKEEMHQEADRLMEKIYYLGGQ